MTKPEHTTTAWNARVCQGNGSNQVCLHQSDKTMVRAGFIVKRHDSSARQYLVKYCPKISKCLWKWSEKWFNTHFKVKTQLPEI